MKLSMSSALLESDSTHVKRYARGFGDNGFDPILGAPYPSSYYQLEGHPQAVPPDPRLTWNVPDVFIKTAGVVDNFVRITLTNYYYPDWAGGTTYILGAPVLQNGTRYRSLADNNQGHDPENGAPWWQEDPTVFVLYWYQSAALKAVRGTTPPLDSAAGFWANEMVNGYFSFFNAAFEGPPGTAWLVQALTNPVVIDGSPPYVDGDDVVWSHLISF